MKTLLCLMALICLNGCMKECPVDSTGKSIQDKQITYYFNFSSGTSTEDGITAFNLVKFDKRNFVGVDSIIFLANPIVIDAGKPGVASLMELYNLTDDVPIANSLISSNLTYDSLNTLLRLHKHVDFLQTGNVYSSLPDKEINLGVRLRSSTNGVTVSGQYGYYIILYRR